ncbi:NAD(P)H-dependent flavin oxidoreductase [Peredibacter starrii]|uniref:Nitronate monooxygenase n=1 Tax=Peredibacter starrii TaxID=28202 RepID=A0AAX4HUW9_9BACT|nr:nitronate monooxygenase [Peredibacter starrii]WPU66744.1 nitronate monooxygenase [Peredibacter starrii]
MNFLGTELPIIQAPMAGANDSAMVIEVCKAGGLGSLPCANLSSDQIRSEVARIRAATDKPFNLNFFCHHPPGNNPEQEVNWKKRLADYYQEFAIDLNQTIPVPPRKAFDEEMCRLVEEIKPAVVSFHFGLPHEDLVKRVKAIGAKVLSSATTLPEALWLEAHGCDAIIAQGFEAGGHRGIFLHNDLSTQVGTMSLVPLIVDSVKIPVIASGGISDIRGVKAAFVLGASMVQVGTAYLFTPEAKVSPVHRKILNEAKTHETALTNVFTGRPARGFMNRIMREVGPISTDAPEFPTAVNALAPLKAKTEPHGSGDFMPLWSGQSAGLAREMSAFDLTKLLGTGM